MLNVKSAMYLMMALLLLLLFPSSIRNLTIQEKNSILKEDYINEHVPGNLFSWSIVVKNVELFFNIFSCDERCTFYYNCVDSFLHYFFCWQSRVPFGDVCLGLPAFFCVHGLFFLLLLRFTTLVFPKICVMGRLQKSFLKKKPL